MPLFNRDRQYVSKNTQGSDIQSPDVKLDSGDPYSPGFNPPGDNSVRSCVNYLLAQQQQKYGKTTDLDPIKLYAHAKKLVKQYGALEVKRAIRKATLVMDVPGSFKAIAKFIRT